MIVVSDTSPLVFLADLGRLDLLPAMYGEVVIPPAVHDELCAGHPREAALDHVGGWIKVMAVRDMAAVAVLAEEIDRGEAEAITLAGELGADLVLIDDSAGRSVAQRSRLRVFGVLGVLLDARKAGLLPAIRPDLIRLRDATRFFLTPRLFSETLAFVGEPE